MAYLPYTAQTFSSGDHHTILKRILASSHKLGPRKIDKPIMLYGAGNLGRLAQEFFEYVGVTVTGVVDLYADAQNKDPFWRKRTNVLFPQEVSEVTKKESLLLICIATAPLIAIRDALATQGWTDIAFFYDVSQSYIDRHPLNNGWFLDKLEGIENDYVETVFRSWGDEMSRAHYLQFLAWRRCRVELLSEEFPVLGHNRYFIPEVVSKLGSEEVFVDAGAHTGSVIPTFLEMTYGKYRHIFIIEPDPTNLLKLRKEIQGKKNVTLIEMALNQAEAEGSLRFYGGFDYASKLDPAGNMWIKTTSLDNLGIAPTFIKMHLEGGEFAALLGGISTISIHRPMLALTVYHDELGVSTTPLLLMRQLVDYRFLFRVHSYAGTGAVIYAIPNER